MRIRLHDVVAIAATTLVAACGDPTTATTVPSAVSRASTPAPTVLSLNIAPDSMVLVLGTSASFAAVEVMSDGTRIPVTARWSSLNLEIVAAEVMNGRMIGVGPGRAVVRAVADGLSATASVVVTEPHARAASDALIVDSFSMIEFQYPSAPGHWFYSPQIRVVAPPGRNATVLLLKVSIPGLDDPIPPMSCGAVLSGGAPRELNGEVYGDWTWTFDEMGHQASSAEATATITYLDDAGTLATLAMRGPIVRGSLPPTYTGGQNGGACFHGYGSGG